MDFTLDIQRDGDVRVLQITDMQTIDANQRRFPERLGGSSLTNWVPEKNEENSYRFIRELVRRTNPDLILITGDIVFGEFDDAGTSFTEFCELMESFEIPWAPVYGNHDNESEKGVEWQNAQFERAKHCFFRKGEAFGNGNYSIAVRQNGKVIRKIAMMDSNGCDGRHISVGFRENQLDWLKNTMQAEPKAPGFVCFHIQTQDFADGYLAAGYQTKPDEKDDWAAFEIGKDVAAKNGDFGKKGEPFFVNGSSIHAICRESGVDGVFAGHQHKNNTSVLFDGVRYTFGLKTGLYDYYDPESIGGVLITLSDETFSVKQVHCQVTSSQA